MSLSIGRALCGALCAGVLVAGCFVDDAPPAALLLDPARPFTSLDRVELGGSAETLATITVVGGSTEATAVAESQSGRFVVGVPLNLGRNELVITATDAAGNSSEPITVVVVREPPRAEIVRLTLPAAVTDADSGTLDVIVDVDNDESEIDLKTLAVTLRLVGYDGAFADLPLVLDRGGHVALTLSGLSVADSAQIVVEGDVADADGVKALDAAGFTVLPGVPAQVDVQLTAIVAAASVGPGAVISVPADTEVDVSVTVSDAQDNVIAGAPLRIDAVGSGARVLGTQIVDATTAGTFDVLAEAAGGVATGTATLTVVAADPDHVELSVDDDGVDAGTLVTASARVVDAFGNTVTNAVPLLEIDAPQAFGAAGIVGGTATASVVVTTAGGYVITATDSTSAATLAAVPLLVVAAAPVNADFFEIDAAGLPYRAGGSARATYRLVDAFGNTNSAVPVVVTINVPNVVVVNDGIGNVTVDGLTLAGDYSLRAQAVGTGLSDDTAVLSIVAGAADRLLLAVDAATVAAGTPVTASARVVDVFGNTLADAVPVIDIDAPQDFAAPVVAAGVTTAVVTVTTAGAYTVSGSDAASPATSAAPLQVVAATPVNADFVEVDPAGLPYASGDPVRLNYQLVDAFGNVNTAVPLVVTVNAPNVSVVDDGAGVVEINGIVRAGSYLVRARAVGTGLADDTETLVVDPNPEAAGFNLVLSAGLIAEQGTLIFSGTDGFGNLIDDADILTSFSDPAAVLRTGNQLTFDRPGTFSILACLTAVPTLCDTEFISVQGLLDTVPPSVAVVVESPITPDVATNGLIAFRADVGDDRSLSELRFVATFGNLGTCTRTGGPVLFSGGTTAASRTFSFNVPSCAVPLDVVDIVVQATDEAGNTRNGADASLTIRDPFQITFPNNPGAFVVAIAAFHDRLDQPQDVVIDPSTAQLSITNNGNDRAIVATIDRAQFDLRDIDGNRVDLPSVRGVAISTAGNQFFGTDDAGNGNPGIVRVRPDLNVDTFVDNAKPGGQATAISQPIRGVVVEETGVDVLCMAARDQDRIYCYGNLDAVPAAPTRLAELGTGGGSRPIALAIDGPDAGGDVDVLFAVFDQARLVRGFTFNAARTTLTAIGGGDVSLTAFAAANELGDIVVGPAPAENLYVCHRSGGRVLKVDRSTVPPTVSVFADGFSAPVGLSFDGASLLVVDENDETVFRLSPEPSNPGSF